MGLAAEHERKAVSLRPASIVDGAYENIYERLMSLEIAPGARIAIDALSRELDISQTPVREALSRLEREGLVRKAHLIGYSAAPQLTRKQFDDLYDFRLLLEPEGARLAAQNLTPGTLAEIEAAAADMQNGGAPVDRTSRYSRFARADAHFHDAILRIGGNNVIRNALSGQHVHLHIFRLMFHARVTEEALDEHERLLAAFRARDAASAHRAMRDHIQRSRDRLTPAFE
ncbi:MAG: GntR family transcriptional regulator [bacterium]